MGTKNISLLELFGKIDEWTKDKSFPMAKVAYKDTSVKGQISIKTGLIPDYMDKAFPTEIIVAGEEISLRSVKALEIDNTRYIIREEVKQ